MTLAKQLFDLIDYGSEGWGFESLQAHENPSGSHVSRGFYLLIGSEQSFFAWLAETPISASAISSALSISL